MTRWLLEHDPDHDLSVAIHLVEDARTNALRIEHSPDGGLELDDEEVHGEESVLILHFCSVSSRWRSLSIFGRSSVGIRIALLLDMLALPHVSGTECIAALTTHFGYRLTRRAGGLASLMSGANLVIVPENATLSPALVAAILRTAKVEPLDFVSAIHTEIDTEPASSMRVA